MADLTLLEGFGDFVRSTMEAWKVPGLAVGVVKDGAVIYLEGFGDRDRERGLPVTPHTRFALASGTKAFTTLGGIYGQTALEHRSIDLTIEHVERAEGESNRSSFRSPRSLRPLR